MAALALMIPDGLMAPDDLRDSYYLHITRSIGAVLRAQSVPPDEPLSDRLVELLNKLDGPEGAAPVRQWTDNA